MGYITQQNIKDENKEKKQKAVEDKIIEDVNKNFEKELLKQNIYEENLEKLKERYMQTMSYFESIVTSEQQEKIRRILEIKESEFRE